MTQRKLRDIAPDAPCLDGGELFIIAECAPGEAGMLNTHVGARTMVTGCPLAEGHAEEMSRLAEILWLSGLRSMTVVTKRDLCCAGYARMVREIVASSGNDLRLRHIVVDDDGVRLSSRESLGIGVALSSG